MGQPVVHFEVLGKDGDKLRSYYAEMFGWKFESPMPEGTSPDGMDYQVTQREGNTAPDGSGIGGGIGAAPEGYDGHVTFYVAVDDVEAALQKAEELGGTRMMGPDEILGRMTIGQFTDPEGHVVGLVTP
ncbi:MAG: Glyoxalase/bleomycin resistance protein/dioxygenase [Solirubrobacterales bacterium]|jgi:predicted enzyme related to lactoylglutathione lyase|nr:Glyoxalase/bleomycin resistance protein/dioxygenase [Solirubrobacterales bacterium]